MKNEINESVYDINMDKLCQNSIELIKYARNITAKQVNNVQIMTYYSLGRWIVEVQQQGKHRAEYGKKIIINLSKKLTEEFGKGFSESTLEKARKFYLTYKDRISETLFTEFAIKKSETVFTIFEEEHPFVVTWSHYLQLMRIENEDERSFYEIEAAREKWGVRDLSRQYNSSLYERLALSMDKDKVQRLSQEGNVITTSKDVLKDPYVLEFVGLEDKYNYSETDLENRLLDNLQQFLLCSRSKFLSKLLKTFDKTFREIFPVFISTKRREKPSAFFDNNFVNNAYFSEAASSSSSHLASSSSKAPISSRMTCLCLWSS